MCFNAEVFRDVAANIPCLLSSEVAIEFVNLSVEYQNSRLGDTLSTAALQAAIVHSPLASGRFESGSMHDVVEVITVIIDSLHYYPSDVLQTVLAAAGLAKGVCGDRDPCALCRKTGMHMESVWECNRCGNGRRESQSNVVHVVTVPIYPLIYSDEQHASMPQQERDAGDEEIDVLLQRPETGGTPNRRRREISIDKSLGELLRGTLDGVARSCDDCGHTSAVKITARWYPEVFFFVELAWFTTRPSSEDSEYFLRYVLEDELDLSHCLPSSSTACPRTGVVDSMAIFRGMHYAAVLWKDAVDEDLQGWWLISDSEIEQVANDWQTLVDYLVLHGWVPKMLGLRMRSGPSSPSQRAVIPDSVAEPLTIRSIFSECDKWRTRLEQEPQIKQIVAATCRSFSAAARALQKFGSVDDAILYLCHKTSRKRKRQRAGMEDDEYADLCGTTPASDPDY